MVPAQLVPARQGGCNLDADRFRDALSRWASGVTIVAVRDGERAVGTTVSAFTALSLEPGLVLIALGNNATVLPYLRDSASFGISILAREHARLAAVFADPLPVGPDPFLPGEPPLVRDALAALSCRVRETRRGGDHVIVTAEVEDARVAGDDPLIRYRRRYRGLDS